MLRQRVSSRRRTSRFPPSAEQSMTGNGKQLAVSVSADTVILDPAAIRKNETAEKISTELSEILGMDYEDVYAVTQKTAVMRYLKKE